MLPLIIGGLISAGSAIMGGIGSAKKAREEQRRYEANMAFQREQFEYQKQLNQLQMDREDTAVTRAMEDYQRNGINKLLAIGNPADTGNYSSTSMSGTEGNPQNLLGDLAEQANGIMNNALQWTQEIKNIQQTQKQNELIDEEIMNQSYKRENMESQTFLNKILHSKNEQEIVNLVKDQMQKEIDYLQTKHDYEINRRYDIRGSDQVNEMLNTYKAVLGELANENSQTREKFKELMEVIKNNQGLIKKFLGADQVYTKPNLSWLPGSNVSGNYSKDARSPSRSGIR